MPFAKTYREEITLAYYCCTVALTIAFFLYGTIYLRYRDRRYQQRQEWRQFAKTIRKKYSKLKAENIPSKISKVKDTFGNIQMEKVITGLDVLRYMINCVDYSSFKTSELDALREDLKSIFPLLNICASLILSGPVPDNIRAELGELVTELGEITLPFHKGEERQTVLKCLKHFGSGGKPTVETERMKNVDTMLDEKALKYIQCLTFRVANEYTHRMTQESDNCSKNYTKCRKFELQFDVLVHDLGEPFNFLKELQGDLEEKEYLSDFAEELRKHLKNLKFSDKIDTENDKLILVKVLHEVRMYIYLILKESKALDDEIYQNIKILREVYERVTIIKPDKVIVRGICERFISDLFTLRKSNHPYHRSESFKVQLVELYRKFHELIAINQNTEPSPPSTERNMTENYQYETSI